MRKRSYLAVIKDNQVLVVREVKDEGFKLPGGRAENNENPQETLIREIKEEIGVNLSVESLNLIGNYIYESSEYGPWETYIYAAQITEDPQPDGKEIEEIAWLAVNSNLPLRPHMQDYILPLLINGGYITQ